MTMTSPFPLSFPLAEVLALVWSKPCGPRLLLPFKFYFFIEKLRAFESSFTPLPEVSVVLTLCCLSSFFPIGRILCPNMIIPGITGYLKVLLFTPAMFLSKCKNIMSNYCNTPSLSFFPNARILWHNILWTAVIAQIIQTRSKYAVIRCVQ